MTSAKRCAFSSILPVASIRSANLSRVPSLTRKTNAAAATFALVALAVTGCGGEGSPDASRSASSAGASCDGKINGPVTIKIATHARNDTLAPVNPRKVYQDLVDEFNATVGKQKQVTAQIVDLGEQAYEQALTASVQKGNAPDVAEVDAPFIGSYAYTDLIQPLGGCVTAAKLATLLPSVVANGQFRGQQYVLGAYDGGMGLWVSRSALAKVGARLPASADQAWTVEEFDALLPKLKAAGYVSPLGISWDYGAGEWRSFGFGPALLSAGGGLLSPDFRSADGVINSAGSVRAMTWFQKWAKAGLLDLSTASGSADRNFTTRKSAISWVGSWRGGAYATALGKDLALVPLPNFGNGSKVFTGSWSFGMVSKTKEPDAAWAFIDFMTSASASKKLSDSEPAVPAVKAVYEADPAYAVGGAWRLYVDNLKNDKVAVPRPQTPAYLATRQAFSVAFGEIISGKDVKEALDKAAKTIDDDIAQNDGYR
jgi:multiple sugar transport system substrate-binding protein